MKTGEVRTLWIFIFIFIFIFFFFLIFLGLGTGLGRWRVQEDCMLLNNYNSGSDERVVLFFMNYVRGLYETTYPKSKIDNWGQASISSIGKAELVKYWEWSLLATRHFGVSYRNTYPMQCSCSLEISKVLKKLKETSRVIWAVVVSCLNMKHTCQVLCSTEKGFEETKMFDNPLIASFSKEWYHSAQKRESPEVVPETSKLQMRMQELWYCLLSN